MQPHFTQKRLRVKSAPLHHAQVCTLELSLLTCDSFLFLPSVTQFWERGGRTQQRLSSSGVDVWGSAWRITWPKVAWRMWCCWRSPSWRLGPPGTLYVCQSLLFTAERPCWSEGSQCSEIQWMWWWTQVVNGKVRFQWKTQVVCVTEFLYNNTFPLSSIHLFSSLIWSIKFTI